MKFKTKFTPGWKIFLITNKLPPNKTLSQRDSIGKLRVVQGTIKSVTITSEKSDPYFNTSIYYLVLGYEQEADFYIRNEEDLYLTHLYALEALKDKTDAQ